MFGVHVNFEDVCGVCQFVDLEDSSPAFLGTVSFEFSDGFVFFLSLGQLPQTVGLQMLVDSLIGLFFGFGFDLAGVQNELIFHDNGHVSYS